MNTCPGNEALTRLVHEITRGQRVAVVLLAENRYRVRRAEVSPFYDPSWEVAPADPRNITVFETVQAFDLPAAMAIVASWESKHGSMPTFSLRPCEGNGRVLQEWVLLGGDGEPVTGALSAQFASV